MKRVWWAWLLFWRAKPRRVLYLLCFHDHVEIRAGRVWCKDCGCRVE